MDVQKMIKRMTESLSASRAFGPAYEKDGVMLIPVAMVAGGGGGGEGPSVSVDEDDDEDLAPRGLDETGQSTGSGGGFGGVVMPVGAYVVKDQQVKWVPAVNPTVVLLAALVLVRMILRARARSARRRRS
jgi:uncharacterized spore protein YtfJ